MSGEKGYIEIDARFDKLAPPEQFGPEYLTYVLWAITPEGRATNLGEVQLDDDDARVQVTTELQAFGLVVTAEPYFAVTQPSDVVVMENVVRDDTKGKVETIQAKYELLKRGSYLMNQDAAASRSRHSSPAHRWIWRRRGMRWSWPAGRRGSICGGHIQPRPGAAGHGRSGAREAASAATRS